MTAAAWEPSSSTEPATAGTIILPTRSEALSLLAVYEEHIEFLHHVTYTPRTYRILNQVYDVVERGDIPPPGLVSLLTSIFASSVAFQYAIGSRKDLLGISRPDARKAIVLWSKATFDCLDTSTRLGSYGLEDLQAFITIFFLMYNLEGANSRTRTGMSLSLGIARDLGLHRLDHPTFRRHHPLEVADKIDLEIKRRIWWHLSVTDWYLGVSGGPQEGTYSVQPRQVATNLPRHIEEADLEAEDASFERPLSEPTASSYLIQRIRLGQICRKIIDATPLGMLGAESINYDDIVALDQEFETFQRELPLFFQDHIEAHQQCRDLYNRRPTVLVQKYIVNMIYQNRRCRLHQPYLVRGFTNSAYAHSRDVCLRSARAVIAIQHQVVKEQLVSASLLALSGVHHHMFFAAVALVMDLCFNRTNGREEEEAARRLEVMDACRILEDANDRSPVAKRFLDSLMDVMKKHKIKLFDAPPPPAEAAAPESAPVPPTLPTEMPDFDPCATAQTEFEEIWQSYIDHGSTMDVPDWAELFDDLQTQFE
ncbi:uncharacterized protein HMPREF1541_06764 [Cyphellophora europaea CBS 101466]|uniref:Transcription factor domain-containing protein n=1 Tax=Cyphellophora europaea (strain CBS 101466) TaxID=1220924 RepID=W2RQB6_CYPE1|nr:uncharacterized protein HMPREF1541_06764 [Cyphellophora europaea CBS 101466]ETN38726.1 hypothetical protein HMPREF1541_06764 [Cyphellophora europaea CBS 101466]